MKVFFAVGHNNVNDVKVLPIMPAAETVIQYERIESVSGVRYVIGSGRLSLLYEYLTQDEYNSLTNVLTTSISKNSVKATVLLLNELGLYQSYNCTVTIIRADKNIVTGYYEDIEIELSQIEVI